MTRAAAMLFVILAWLAVSQAAAADRYALVVSGANGESSYADQYAKWRQALVSALRQSLEFEESHIVTLFDGADAEHASTAVAVRRELAALRGRMRADDVLLVVLLGHGTADAAGAKFNLIGPDMDSKEWGALLKPLPGRLVLVDCTASSFPFLEHLAGPRRIVITATDSIAQRFDTVFPEYFIRALTDPQADIDKNGRTSVWEAFINASLGVRRYYEQRGQLATEHALIDDTGDGRGREAGGEGDDGSAASRFYLQPDDPDAAPTDEALLTLLQKRAELQLDADELKQRRALMTPDEYDKEFERLMIELAKVSREIRRKGAGS